MPEKRTTEHTPSSEFPPRNVVCTGAIVVREERVLFVHQAPGQSLAGKWSIPWGFVEQGETPDAAALRETLEEGGVSAALDGLLGVQNLRQPGWIGVIFRCHPLEGEPRPDGVETDDAAYFSAEKIEALGKTVCPWCRWIALRVLKGEGTLIPCELDHPMKPESAFL